jgi:hypothetical protein
MSESICSSAHIQQPPLLPCLSQIQVAVAVLEEINNINNNNNNNNRVLYPLRQESRLYTVSSDLAFSVGKQIDEQFVLQESDLYLPFH